MRDVGLTEQGIGDRDHDEGDHEQADPAIGQQGAGQHHGQDRARSRPSRAVRVRAMASAEPLSSISLPKTAPSRKIGKNWATKPPRHP